MDFEIYQNRYCIFFYSYKDPYKGFLSQWYPSLFTEDGLTFSCAEQYMMYHKAKLFGDVKTAARILLEKKPFMQKRLGRQVKGFEESVWQKHRREIVKQGNWLKFNQNPELLEMLINRFPVCKDFVEASKYDRIWGIGFDAKTALQTSKHEWGQNLLGQILTELRDELL